MQLVLCIGTTCSNGPFYVICVDMQSSYAPHGAIDIQAKGWGPVFALGGQVGMAAHTLERQKAGATDILGWF